MLKPSKFNAGEGMGLSGQPYWVTAKWQYTLPDESAITRYLLTDANGKTVTLEERGREFALLRAFPPASQPEVTGPTVSVMGVKYALGGVQKLTFLAAEGAVPAHVRSAPVLLSGRFSGEMGNLLRELAPGSKAQQFYSVKPVPAGDLLTAKDVEAMEAAAAQIKEEQKLEKSSETGDSSAKRWIVKGLKWLLILVVVGVLLSLCSSDDDDDGHSARGVHGGHHRGK